MTHPRTRKSEETRERLLKAATDHFAAHGYRQARLQDICHDAEANQAAANYHFGGKYELYLEALRDAQERAKGRFPLPNDAAQKPEARLRAFVEVLCRRIFDENEGSLFPRMFVKEMAEPTEALDTILRELIAEQRNTLLAIIKDCLGPKATEQDVLFTHISVVALFQFFNFSRSIRQMIQRKKCQLPLDIDATIEHTVGFALAGVRAKKREIDHRVSA